MFSVCPGLHFLRSRDLGCWGTWKGIGSSCDEGGVANRTRGLGVTMSFRAGFLTTGVSLRLGLSVVDTMAVESCDFGDPAHCVLFDGEVPVPACFFAKAAHLSTLLMAFLAPGSSSRNEAKPNPLGVLLLRLTVASEEFCSCVSALLLLSPSNRLRESGSPLVLIQTWKCWLRLEGRE